MRGEGEGEGEGEGGGGSARSARRIPPIVVVVRRVVSRCRLSEHDDQPNVRLQPREDLGESYRRFGCTPLTDPDTRICERVRASIDIDGVGWRRTGLHACGAVGIQANVPCQALRPCQNRGGRGGEPEGHMGPGLVSMRATWGPGLVGSMYVWYRPKSVAPCWRRGAGGGG